MKKRVLLGMASLLLSVSLLMAQEIPAGVITAFKRGSSQELSKYCLLYTSDAADEL